MQVRVSSWCLSLFLVPSQNSSTPFYPFKVLRTKERASTFYSSVVFSLDSHLSPSKSWVYSITRWISCSRSTFDVYLSSLDVKGVYWMSLGEHPTWIRLNKFSRLLSIIPFNVLWFLLQVMGGEAITPWFGAYICFHIVPMNNYKKPSWILGYGPNISCVDVF